MHVDTEAIRFSCLLQILHELQPYNPYTLYSASELVNLSCKLKHHKLCTILATLKVAFILKIADLDFEFVANRGGFLVQ